MPLQALLVKAALAAALAGGAVTGVASQSGSASGAAGSELGTAVALAVPTYAVRSGDTLYNIAARFCGNGSDYPALARASGIADPNVIDVGKVIVLSCHGSTVVTNNGSGSASAAGTDGDGDHDGDNSDVQGGSNNNSLAANGQANIPGTYPDVFSYYGLEQLWLAAGGAYGERGVAACIAQHESGGRTWATGAHGERGLWQIAPGWGSLSVYYPVGNAHAAVVISHNGSNWGAWTTAGSC
jgi:hypothetical protein